MTPERWQRIQSLLHTALAMPVEDRARYVTGVCAGDAELQRDVESLLAQASQGSGFLSAPAFDLAAIPAGSNGGDDASLVGRTIGTFSIKARLGSGGMGDVYLADDSALRRPVAIKALREDGPPTAEGRDRLLREARAAAALNHPNIATIFHVLDSVDAVTPPLMVMEYIEGDTLSALLASGPLPMNDALRFARDVADALCAAHHLGIVHRDLKPANLRVNQQRRIKVLDFGLARRLAPAVDTSTMTVERALQTIAPHRIAGTPGYTAPEQALGRLVEPPADIFSLGVVLFEMLTGRRPFPGDDLVSAGIAMMTLPTPRVAALVPGIPADLDALIDRMLAREPALRPSAASVLADLESLQRTGSVASNAHAVPIGTAVVTLPSRRQLAVFSAIVVVVSVSAYAARAPLRRMLGLGPSGPPTRISLALLPVEAPGGDARAEQIGAGLMALISGNLGSLPRLTVISRAATAPYSKDLDDFLPLQRALGVTHVLRLSWRSTEPALQLTTRLYLPGTVTPQWEETFAGDAARIERGVLAGLARTLERNPGRRFTDDEWKRVVRLPTENSQALSAYAEAMAQLDRAGPGIDRAVTLLQQAVGLDSQFVLAWAALGDAVWRQYVRDKNPSLAANATDALRHALAIDPDSASVHYALGGMQYRTGQPVQAEASYRRALQLQPDFEAAQRDLAQVFADAGRVDEGEALLREAIRVSNNWNNFFMLGTIDYRAGRYASAVEAFTHATEAAPNSAASYTMLGTSQYVLGNVEQAVGNFEHAVRLGPAPATYANLALAYYDAGRLDDALQSYEEALKRDPKSVVNRRNIGDVKARLGRRADAVAEYERAIALGNALLAVNPRDIRTIGLVALCEAKLGSRASAERHAAEAVALDSSSRDAWQKSAEVHALLNQPEAALRDLEIAVARGFEPRMARRDGELASIQKLPRFEEILALSPGNAAKQ